MSALSGALQSIGGLASDIGAAKQIRFNQQRDQLQNIMDAVRLQMMQQQMKQAMMPQAMGTVKAPTGAEYGLTFDPTTGQFKTQQVIAGFDPNAVRQTAAGTISAFPETIRPIAQGIFDMYDRLGQPDKGLTALSAMAEKSELFKSPKPPKVEYDQGIPVGVSDDQGNAWSIYDPNLPPELRQLANSALKAHQQRITEENLAKQNQEAFTASQTSAKEAAQDARFYAALFAEKPAQKEKNFNDTLNSFKTLQTQANTALNQAKAQRTLHPVLGALGLAGTDVGEAQKAADRANRAYSFVLGNREAILSGKADAQDVINRAQSMLQEPSGVGGDLPGMVQVIRDPKTGRIIGVQ